jgi:hypothetical protein
MTIIFLYFFVFVLYVFLFCRLDCHQMKEKKKRRKQPMCSLNREEKILILYLSANWEQVFNLRSESSILQRFRHHSLTSIDIYHSSREHF